MKTETEKSANIALVIYILQAVSFFTGITAIIGLIIGYIKQPEAKGTWVASHFRWQLRTFWFGLLWSLIGVVTVVILVGYFILLANLIWIIYRIVKGWLNLNDEKPMYQDDFL